MNRSELMSRDEVFEKMLELLRQQLGDPQLDITPESSLHDDLAIDSIALTEFIIIWKMCFI